MFFDTDESLMKIRNPKELYIEFNSTKEKNKAKVNDALFELVDNYSKSEFSYIRKLNHKQEINITYLDTKKDITF